MTIDADLMDAADLLEGEQVTIVDIDNGGPAGDGAITGRRGRGDRDQWGGRPSGASGDLVILIAYATLEDAEARRFRPRVVFVDGDNRQIDVGDDAARIPDDAEGLLSPRVVG